MATNNTIDAKTEDLVRLYFQRDLNLPYSQEKVPLYHPNEQGIWRIISANPFGKSTQRFQVGELIQGRFIDVVVEAVDPYNPDNRFYNPNGEHKWMLQDINRSGWVEKVEVRESHCTGLDQLANELAEKYI